MLGAQEKLMQQVIAVVEDVQGKSCQEASVPFLVLMWSMRDYILTIDFQTGIIASLLNAFESDDNNPRCTSFPPHS